MVREKGRLLTTTQAAEILYVHPNTIRRWAKEGRIKYFRLKHERGDRRFWRGDVEKMLEDMSGK